MTLGLRKFVVGLVALGALLAVYLLYEKVIGTPTVGVNMQDRLPAPAAGDDIDPPDDRVGVIADVGVVAVKQTRFFHTNEKNQIDREFGFEELLHTQGDQWEITNPFMKLFLPEFRCDVTAERGQVQVETAFGQPMANDAMFEGNVVIHVIPAEPNDPKECFIYLDDVAFVAEKSLFSSSGSVEFVSRSALLTGIGMELLYDSARSRLELFRIIDLEALRLRSAEIGELSSLTSEAPAARAPASPGAAAARPEAARAAGDYYECVFSKNVAIDTPERVIMARERLSINNILWSGSAAQEGAPEPNAPDVLPFPGRDALDTTASTQLALESIPEEFFDIVVTCDAGFVVAPMGVPRAVADPCHVALAETSPDEVSAQAAALPDRQRAIARRIEYDAATANTTLTGPVEMTLDLDPNDLAGDKAGGEPMPMTITAQEAVRFVSASNQVLFDGGCVATVTRAEPNLSYDYVLTAPAFTLDLARNPDASASQEAIALQRFSAGGGAASVLIVKRAAQELVGWTQLQAAQLDYEPDENTLTAYGPGMVTIRSAQTSDGPPDPNGFAFDRPCYAFIRDFDMLTFSSADSRIVAHAESQPMLLDYIPLIDGRYGRAMKASAGHIEIILQETDQGRTELAFLAASRGISYVDETKQWQFDGSTLTYEHEEALVRVVGDESQPCYFNNALVDHIEWNVKTDELKAEIAGPSILQVNR